MTVFNLQQLNKKKCISISKIEWWLLKYSNIYKQIIAFNKSKNVSFRLDDASISKLPPLDESTKHREFLDLYRRLDNISELHRYENYFEQQMKEFSNIKDSHYELKKWVAKNEHLGANKFVLFLVDYLDYSENPEHLNVYFPYSKEFDLYIDRKDFKNTIDFLEIFNELYWVQEILPESMKRIRIEMEQTKTTANNGNRCTRL